MPPNDPPVILADEPTANLDSKHGHEVAKLLRNAARDEERSVVIVSHDARLKDIADRVLWLEDGRFLAVSEMAIDPVCGMAVERDGGMHYRYEGRPTTSARLGVGTSSSRRRIGSRARTWMRARPLLENGDDRYLDAASTVLLRYRSSFRLGNRPALKRSPSTSTRG